MSLAACLVVLEQISGDFRDYHQVAISRLIYKTSVLVLGYDAGDRDR